MAIVVKFSVAGMSTDKYEMVLKRLEKAGAGAPKGRLYHVSYGSKAGLNVIDVYASPQDFDNFGKVLVPILQEMGIKAEPEVQEVHKIIKG